MTPFLTKQQTAECLTEKTNEMPAEEQVTASAHYVTPLANLFGLSRNSKQGTLYQHPSVEKKVSNTFNISSSHSGVVVSSQSYTMPGKKPDLKSVVTK